MKSNFLFLFSNLLTVFLLSFIGTNSYAAGLEKNTDRLGMDYRRILLPAAKPELCQNECASDSQCKSFTFVKRGLHDRKKAVCYLKNSEPNPTPNNCCVSGLRPEVTQSLARSPVYQNSLAWLAQHPQPPVTPQTSGATGVSRQPLEGDALQRYALECDEATGITVPEFNCDDGTVVPTDHHSNDKCDKPNVLSGVCDPGSKFQVLPGGNADAVAVAHCRKHGYSGSLYGDIAVIQYNKKNGATCFYQNLGTLTGQKVPAPSVAGQDNWQPNGSRDVSGWYSPERTVGAGCTGCHDNGGFIRSPYLAQLAAHPAALQRVPPHVLPSTAEGFNNLDTPVKYVGEAYKNKKSWSIHVEKAPGDNEPNCNVCHRLAVNNHNSSGTAKSFAVISTAATQSAKNPHSPASPIWMRPGQVTYTKAAEDTAKKYQECATKFINSNYSSLSIDGCTMTPLAGQFVPAPTPCGNEGERECLLSEYRTGCRSVNLKASGGMCIHPPCGRVGEKPCRGADARIPSCDLGLYENFGADKCESQSTPCGNEGERECLLSEYRTGCRSVNLKASGGMCIHPPCGRVGEKPCGLGVRIPSCDFGLNEDFFAGRCIR